jgi:hypothetical protein
MACMVNTLTLEKDKDSGIKLESATPAVDHPDGEVDQREVRERDVVVTSPCKLWSTAATLFSFIKLYKIYSFTRKENKRVKYSIYR